MKVRRAGKVRCNHRGLFLYESGSAKKENSIVSHTTLLGSNELARKSWRFNELFLINFHYCEISSYILI